MTCNSFTILGSSSGLPQANRASSGYLLKTGESLSLIDCGGGVTSSFLKCGFKPLSVDRIFISHSHPDHCCELPLFIQMIYLKGRVAPLDIYIPEDFVEPFNNYLNAVYLIKEKMPFELNVVGYSDKFVFHDEFKLTALENNHLLGYKDLIDRLKLPNKMKCHSFMIEVDGKKIFYSADIKSLDDIKEFLNGNDYLILEATHINLEEFFKLAHTIEVGQYIITHLGTEEEINMINLKAQKNNIENLITAEDGMVIEI